MGSWENLLEGRRAGARKGSLGNLKTDTPVVCKLNYSKSSVSGKFRLDTQSPKKSLSDSGGEKLKIVTPRTSPGRASLGRTSPVGEAAESREGSPRGDGSVRSKLEVPDMMRRNSCSDTPTMAEVAAMAAMVATERRGSIGSFTLSPPRPSRRASDGSCKMDESPSKGPTSVPCSPSKSLQKEVSGGTVVTVRRSPSASYRSASGSSKLPRLPPKVPPREIPASLRLDAPRRSPSGGFPRELSRSLKVEQQRKIPADAFQRETSRSLKVETPSRSPSTTFQKEIAGLKLETRRSPSGSFKSPSGSFKSPSGSFRSPSSSFRNPADLFSLETHRKGSSGSFKLEAPRKGSSGSFKLGTPRQSPSGSSLRGIEGCTCPRRGSSESQAAGSRRESQGSFTVDTLAGPVLQYSPGSGQSDTVGNFKIDSTTEGQLVVTQMAASPSRQPGSRPDKLRIVCPLDSKIRIELKMD